MTTTLSSHFPKLAAACALALGLAACGDSAESDPYLDYLPAEDAVTIELQGGAAEGALTLAAEAATTPNTNVEDLAQGKEKLKALNQSVREVFAHVIAVAKDGQQQPGETKVYGPADRCVEPEGSGCAAGGVANLRLKIVRGNGNLGRFLLEARPQGSTDDGAFAPVLAGYLAKGAANRRGSGKLAVNFENLGAAAPGFTGQGYALAGFFAGPVVKSVTYRMAGFTRDPADHDPVTATFHGFRTEAGVTRVRLAGLEDLDTSGADTELGFWHLVHHPALGGRSYTIVSNYLTPAGAAHGDVPTGPAGGQQYWFGRACYAPGASTPTYKEWFLCARAAGPAACVAAAGGVGTPVTGTGTWQSNCAVATEPGEFALPAGAPAANADDASTEAGHPVLSVPPLPTTTTDVEP